LAEKIRDQHLKRLCALSARQGDEQDENSEAGAPAATFNLSSALNLSSKDQGTSKCLTARASEGSLGAVETTKKKKKKKMAAAQAKVVVLANVRQCLCV
jgi:hypothetical protein